MNETLSSELVDERAAGAVSAEPREPQRENEISYWRAVCRGDHEQRRKEV
jgi:hypothetical protein